MWEATAIISIIAYMPTNSQGQRQQQRQRQLQLQQEHPP